MQQAMKKFVAEHCVQHPAALVSVADFSGAFRMWCSGRGLKPPSRREILSAVQLLGYAVGVKSSRLTIVGLAFDQVRFVVDQGVVIKTTMRAAKLPEAVNV
jgi:hypothetical protein